MANKETRYKAPGRAFRKGISLIELMEMFPDEESAKEWIESVRWPNGERQCPKCGSTNTVENANRKPAPHRCRACRKFFSVKVGSIMESSPIPLRKWVIAVYLVSTSLKGVSSMKLHRDLGISQPSAWFMAHRIRKALEIGAGMFLGTVEVDETYMGGKESNKHENKKLKFGRGAVGKTAVVGTKDRDANKVKARAIGDTKHATLHGFINENVEKGSTVCTDDFKSYEKLDDYDHHTVKHSAGEYVDEMIHINGMESFWSTMKRAHKGTYHKMSVKHLNRYVTEFAGRHNIRERDTVDQMKNIVAGMVGKRLMYSELTKQDVPAEPAMQTVGIELEEQGDFQW